MIRGAHVRGSFGFCLRRHGRRILAGKLDLRIVSTTLTPTAPSHLRPRRDAFSEQERLSDAARHTEILAGHGDINFHSSACKASAPCADRPVLSSTRAAAADFGRADSPLGGSGVRIPLLSFERHPVRVAGRLRAKGTEGKSRRRGWFTLNMKRLFE
jgi:hypothetical protein